MEERIQKMPEKGYSPLTNSSSTDPVRDLLKQVWRQHNVTVQELKAELLAVRQPCQQCEELKSELLSKDISFQTKLDEKENTIKYLRQRIQSLLLIKEKGLQIQQLCRKDILDSKPSLGTVTVVPETQDGNVLPISAVKTKNPVIFDTFDLEGGLNSEECTFESYNEVKPVYRIEESVGPVVLETLDILHKPNNKRKNEDVIPNVCKNDTEMLLEMLAEEEIEKDSQSKICKDLNFQNVKENNLISKSKSLTMLPSCKRNLQFINSEQLNNSTESSPSLLFGTLKAIKSINENSNPTEDIADNSGSCEFLSSAKNQLSFRGEESKSPNRKRSSSKNFSFSPSKKTARKVHLKQTKLERKKQLTFDGLYRLEAVEIKTKCEPAKSTYVTENEVLLDEMSENSRDTDATFFEEPTTVKDISIGRSHRIGTNIKYQEVVRKKDERKQLDGHNCHECEMYYKNLNLSEEELKKRMKNCSRHRAKYSPEKSPEHFWEVDLPNTQECIDRGYLNKTQPFKLTSRQRKAL